MIGLTLFLLGALVVLPLVLEAARLPMNDEERDTAPGQFAKLSQGVTHYQWIGPEEGPVVVCIHGLTTPSFVWQSLSADLAKLGYRVLTYDLYGRGYSDRPFCQQTPEFFLQQLNDLLEDQEVEGDLAVIGYSMGGIIAPAFAASCPDNIRQVVLLAPAGMSPLGSDLIRFMLQTPVIGAWLMLLLYPRILKRGLEAEADLPSTVPGITSMQASELNYRGFIPAVYASMRGMLTDDFHETHEALCREGIPVLAIWGQQDDVIPIESKDALSDWNPDSLHHVIQDAGHGLTYTHTAEVVEQIQIFLKMSA